MADENDLDIRKVIEKGTQRTTLKDLAQRGFESVKVLDETAVQDLITRAVDRVVTSHTAEERARILAESRKELDRLLKEHRAARSRAELLESDKHELIERVEALQREIQLKSELEEETLHRKLEQGLASLQTQFEELRSRYQAAVRDVESLRGEAARSGEERDRLRAEAEELRAGREGAAAEVAALQAESARLAVDRDRVEKEAEGTLARLGRLEKELAEEQSRARGAEKARTDLVAQILGLQAGAAASESEVKGLRAEAIRQRSELARLAQEREREAERLRAEIGDLSGRLDAESRGREEARRESAELRTRLDAEERARREAGEREQAAAAERARLLAGRQEEADRLRAEIAGLSARLSAESLEGEQGRRESGELRKRLEELERVRAASAAEAAAERERLDARHREAERKAEAAGRAEAELGARLAGIEELRAASDRELEEKRGDLAELQAELEAARQEAAFLHGQIAQQQKDHEVQREKTVIVTAELQEIEERQRQEQQELERLRADSARLTEDRERLRKDLDAGRGEIEALQDLLRREQEAARTAQNEAVSLQARHQELLSRSADAEREIDRLRAEKAGAEERLASADAAARLAALLETARRNSSAAKASALRSREVTADLERVLFRRQRPPRRARGASVRSGAAFDGMAVLEGFFRKIRLKERFQKHLPVRERPGRPHPSEAMVEVLKAILSGDGRGRPPGRAVPIEVVGPSNAPDAAALRQFLGGLSTQAVQSLSRVHDALRLHLSPLPRKPQPLVLDVAPIELALGRRKGNRRTYRPLVCFDPAAGEFWNGRFRSGRVPAADGALPFLQSCIARVPKPFARGRIRFRMDSSFFNEAVVRFLDQKGVSYVIEAPDSAAVRKGARRCAFTRLSNGWEVGEFRLRLHPIRRTQGRFVVLRRRLSKAALEAGPGLFKDERHVYHAFATDGRGTPWRSFEFYRGRPASLERARALLAEFPTSPLLGRSRRSVAALFQAQLLASDLVQAFRRGCLPAEHRGRGLDELRNDFLLPAVPKAGGAPRSLAVLPRRDPRRALFSRVARLTRRLKPARPFRLRR